MQPKWLRLLMPHAVLDAYREAVVEKVMSPDFKVTIPIMRDDEL
jgi:hypothetical protein